MNKLNSNEERWRGGTPEVIKIGLEIKFLYLINWDI